MIDYALTIALIIYVVGMAKLFPKLFRYRAWVGWRTEGIGVIIFDLAVASSLWMFLFFLMIVIRRLIVALPFYWAMLTFVFALAAMFIPWWVDWRIRRRERHYRQQMDEHRKMDKHRNEKG